MPYREKVIESTLIWDQGDEIWDQTNFLWTDEIIRLKIGGSSGGLKKQWDTWKSFNDQEKKRVIKVILQLKGVDFKQTKAIKNYKVTIEDIKMLMEAFEKSLKERNITIDEIKVKPNE